jgi:predicted RNase H-like HicB family nuclease
MMRYMVVVEHGNTSWGAHVPDLPGCIAVAETREKVVDLIRRSIALHIDELKQRGLPVPKPSSEGEFVEVEAAKPLPAGLRDSRRAWGHRKEPASCRATRGGTPNCS